MKNKKIWKYIFFLLIILMSYLFIKYADIILTYNGVMLNKMNSKLSEKSFCGKYGCRAGVALDDKIYREFNDVVIASITSSQKFTIDPVNFYKFYYDENDDSFFSENIAYKSYKKVSEEDIDEISGYFDFIYNNYYDDKIFPKGFNIKEVISENDYYYILDEFYIDRKLYKQYYSFKFYYYDIEEHVLYCFRI